MDSYQRRGQKLLRLGHFAEKRFSTFFSRGNENVVAHIRKVSSPQASENDRQVFVYGPTGCGKTHLLQAACRNMAESDRDCAYFSVAKHLSTGTRFLVGLDKASLLAIDDVHLVSKSEDLQLSLLQLIEDVRSAGGRLLISSKEAPENMKTILPDLKSRLIWGGTYRLREVPDNDKQDAVFFSLPVEVVQLLKQRCATFSAIVHATRPQFTNLQNVCL